MEGKRMQTGRGKNGKSTVYSCEVLHRVLYPNVHKNGFKKKRIWLIRAHTEDLSVIYVVYYGK